MAVFGLTVLVMVAFAANSILNRVGVATYGMDPMVFAAIRTAAGAAMLGFLVIFQGGRISFSSRRVAGALALAVYMIGFSWAYLTLGAGLGALILFGVLQVVVFAFAIWRGDRVPFLRKAGAWIALVGLITLLFPGEVDALPLGGMVAMAAAGIAWAIYTLLGQGEPAPVAASAGNFVICLPLVLLALPLAGDGVIVLGGVIAALIAGAVTSGLGYALWYRVLPRIPTTMAAIAQLSVPVIAVLAGIVLLDEQLTLRIVIAGGLVLGGIALSLVPQRRIGSSAS